MAAPTRVFVSHSSQDNELTREVCELLGGAAGHEILVDLDSLEDGRAWPTQLHEMMADCQAAVVLLSSNAVASAWVLKEMTILTWRSALEPNFKLFVAQFPDVTEAQLTRARYDPLQHRLIQGISTSDPAAIVARVRESLDRDAVPATQTLFDRLIKALAGLIEDVNTDALQGIADALGVPSPRWRPNVAPQRQQVERVACALLRGELGTYADLRALMNELKATRLSNEVLKKLLRLLAPHWVDPQAAGQLGGLVAHDAGAARCHVAAINGNHARRYTAKMYIQRAFPLRFEYRVHGARPPAPGNTLDHYTASICKDCRKLEAYEELEDAEIVEKLAQNEPWLFVVISAIDQRALAELRARFPKVRFLIDLGGAQLDSAAVPEGVLSLLPAVDTDVEARQCNGYDLARNVIGNE